MLRYAEGDEVTLRERQAIGLRWVSNALIVGNYLPPSAGARLTHEGSAPQCGRRMSCDVHPPGWVARCSDRAEWRST
jgi:hypothetical protein